MYVPGEARGPSGAQLVGDPYYSAGRVPKEE